MTQEKYKKKRLGDTIFSTLPVDAVFPLDNVLMAETEAGMGKLVVIVQDRRMGR